MTITVTKTSYRTVRRDILSGDLLLWRPSGLFGKLICAASGSRHSHAGIAAWIKLPSGVRRLVSLETVEGRGGVVQPLSELVKKWPGLIDVYRANAGNRWLEFERAAVVTAFWDNVIGSEYGKWAAVKAALRKMLVLRMFLKPDYQDGKISGSPPFCSGAVSRWTREGGGVDPVPGLADDSTWPGHLENSSFYELKCEGLVP